MPELPEVEVTRRSLDGPLQGARILALRLGKPLRWPLGRDPSSIVGLTLGPISRRGKYLWLALDGRDDAGGLLMHLGMSGSLALHRGEPPPAGPHDHFELETSQGTAAPDRPAPLRRRGLVGRAGLGIRRASCWGRWGMNPSMTH
jgi:formamidopyrimidine-DNA glycosylase